ncbi:MAG: cupin domain-containing protein [Gammaproteobacteria bacterium]|nr:cupin domain-containing protein [Gammaproteobacteria bacterium]
MNNKLQDGWQIFQLDELLKMVEGNDPRFHEFLHKPSMSMGVYRLPRGSKDMQSPHLEDEIYVVLDGKATLTLDGEDREAVKGSILFVAANTTHSFFNIEEDLTVLAFFGSQLPPVASYTP